MTPAPPLFFFGAMSPYSWLAAERIEGLLPAARWRVVLAGVIFAAHDRVSWGLTPRRAEGMLDCERRAASYGLGPIRWPKPWPTSDLHISRALLFAEPRGALQALALTAMRMAFLEGADIAERDAVLEAARRCELDPDELESGLVDPGIKQILRERNEEALRAGVFGVPTVLVGGELFWGDDRLAAAAALHADQ